MTKTKKSKGSKVGQIDNMCGPGERKFAKRETRRLRRRLAKQLQEDLRLKALICGYVS